MLFYILETNDSEKGSPVMMSEDMWVSSVIIWQKASSGKWYQPAAPAAVEQE